MNLQRLNLSNMVNEVIQDLSSKARDKGIKITNNIETGKEIIADYERLKQVFYNLIDNAIKYGRINGNVWIDAKTDDKSNIVISVKDDGPGIPPEARERIFERFYRIDKARSREQGGTGLGLSIVKHIVQSHGGKVWVESRFGSGSTFLFTIPQDKKQIASSG
jgi:two-component system phosphate regulon sensor histidine kinase PhoR